MSKITLVQWVTYYMQQIASSFLLKFLNIGENVTDGIKIATDYLLVIFKNNCKLQVV